MNFQPQKSRVSDGFSLLVKFRKRSQIQRSPDQEKQPKVGHFDVIANLGLGHFADPRSHALRIRIGPQKRSKNCRKGEKFQQIRWYFGSFTGYFEFLPLFLLQGLSCAIDMGLQKYN